jgi:hypothetical protein
MPGDDLSRAPQPVATLGCYGIVSSDKEVVMANMSGSDGALRPGAGLATERETVRDETIEPTEELLPSGREGTGVSPEVRQKLDEQIAAAGGNIDQLVRDIRARIDEIDSRPMPEEGIERQQLQADRAFYVAQISYLEQKLHPDSKA